ncbi:MAG: O-sialoglycoprotein endopeptidase [Acidaminococcus sp.]|jgi:N6-L-threonylcarbamoyladenine synthase|nr:O-sialoglycoprotein endopeptidase [Acidaminococcus sp.]MCI2099400.1 O-sialoglycoprotein endopeptidase [Acidaminococcus sp.]MCI2113760.1 O-sialoglycoprotein endopeptidase [Acidaminococcus sp.]MCI2115666.1 O-sialoglycoprotein endopeptidase [Acidaminococcus sp.]
MPEEAVLGIDTSCYTTSVAILSMEGTLLEDRRRVLSVKPGRRGLAQSEMVFQHTRNLPELIESCRMEKLSIRAIGVSNKPRPLIDSYMPAFLTGFGLARSLAHVLRVPLHVLTHQHNHMFAGLWSVRKEAPAHFLVVHVSGGTTDLLLADKNDDGEYALTPQGTSIDLHAGQMIDRVGVAIGLPFPCGRHLEKLAFSAKEAFDLPVWTDKGNMSLSGPATKALRALEQGADPASVALGTERVIAKGLVKTISSVCEAHDLHEVLFVGGVSANEEIRTQLKRHLTGKQIEVWTPDPAYSVDGAVGCAFYALRKERNGHDFW